MRSSSVFVLLPVLAVALPTTPTAVHDVARSLVARAPPEAKAVLKSVSSEGTGCAGNSASFIFGDDAVIGFDNMVVDTTLTDKSKRCTITLDLQLDPKWKYTINKQTDVRGYVDTAGGSYTVAYTVAGKKSEVSNPIPADPSGGSWHVSSQSAGATSAYGGGAATIDVVLRLVSTGTEEALVALDSLDVGFEYSQ